MKPVINSFQVRLEYPTYTGRKNETLENTGDLIIPVGTKVNWYFNSEYTDHLYFKSLEDKEKQNYKEKEKMNFNIPERS